MAESYSSKVVFKSTPEQVSKLLRMDETSVEPWQPEDLRAMVRHQLATPIAFDVRSVKLSQSEQDTLNSSLGDATHPGIRTFADLFYSPHPPVELLRLSHKFFKQNVTNSGQGSPDQKLAHLFYLLSIVVARIRAGARISRLPDDELVRSIQSVMNRPWVDERIRGLLTEGRNRISSGSSR